MKALGRALVSYLSLPGFSSNRDYFGCCSGYAGDPKEIEIENGRNGFFFEGAVQGIGNKYPLI
jgi:hypothetical protein